MPRKSKRLDRAEDALRNMPVRTDLLQKAFERFRDTGELPQERRLAIAVCQQALNGGKPVPVGTDDNARMARLVCAAFEAARSGRPVEGRSVRKCVFSEAVHADGPVQRGARGALVLHIGFLGKDPCDPQFLADESLPEHGGVGLYLLGFPQELVQPPYEEQGQRLLARAADLRNNRIDHDDPKWAPALDAAIKLLHEYGELPEDEVLRDAVLVTLELQTLMCHSRGENVSYWMAVLDAAALSTGDERESAIAKVQEYARARLEETPTSLAPR